MIRWYPRSRRTPPGEPPRDNPGSAGPARSGSAALRLVTAPDQSAGTPADIRTERRFAAIILLDQDAAPDVGAVAATTATRFPGIGRIEAIPASGPTDPDAVVIDGGRITLRRLPGRVPSDWLASPLQSVRPWDPELAVLRHVAAVEVSCGGELSGLDGAKAYAAAAHFVAAAACQVLPAAAVLWREGCVVNEPASFAQAADAILAGRTPVGSWVGIATVPSPRAAPKRAAGVVTYGLRQFIGREMELAPVPSSMPAARRTLARMVRWALEDGRCLSDGQHLADPGGAFSLRVRERSSWLRPGVPAFVLVPVGSAADLDAPDSGNEVA